MSGMPAPPAPPEINRPFLISYYLQFPLILFNNLNLDTKHTSLGGLLSTDLKGSRVCNSRSFFSKHKYLQSYLALEILMILIAMPKHIKYNYFMYCFISRWWNTCINKATIRITVLSSLTKDTKQLWHISVSNTWLNEEYNNWCYLLNTCNSMSILITQQRAFQKLSILFMMSRKRPSNQCCKLVHCNQYLD